MAHKGTDAIVNFFGLFVRIFFSAVHGVVTPRILDEPKVSGGLSEKRLVIVPSKTGRELPYYATEFRSLYR